MKLDSLTTFVSIIIIANWRVESVSYKSQIFLFWKKMRFTYWKSGKTDGKVMEVAQPIWLSDCPKKDVLQKKCLSLPLKQTNNVWRAIFWEFLRNVLEHNLTQIWKHSFNIFILQTLWFEHGNALSMLVLARDWFPKFANWQNIKIGIVQKI